MRAELVLVQVVVRALPKEQVDDDAQGRQYQDGDDDPHSAAAASASTSASPTNHYSASTSHDHPFRLPSMCTDPLPGLPHLKPAAACTGSPGRRSTIEEAFSHGEKIGFRLSDVDLA